MDKRSERENAVRAWLTTGEAQSLVKRAARSVLRMARQKGCSFAFIGFDSAMSLENGAILDDIESELKLYILEDRRGIQEKILLSGPKAGWVLQHGFMQDWIDASRRRESDRWRYLYKRAVEGMRAYPEFARKGGRKEGIFYSLAEESVFIPELSEEDFGCIVLPETMLPSASYDDLKSSEKILGLAKYFWNELSAQWGGKTVWVPVRSLINWIARHVDLSYERRVDSGRDQRDPLEAIPDERSLPEALFDGEAVARWAERFAASLDRNEGVAFSLHCGDGLTLAEVAERLGYKNPSGPSYLIDKTKQKLKRFVRDLAWLSPPDLNEEAWSLFTNALFSHLKKNHPKP